MVSNHALAQRFCVLVAAMTAIVLAGCSGSSEEGRAAPSGKVEIAAATVTPSATATPEVSPITASPTPDATTPGATALAPGVAGSAAPEPATSTPEPTRSSGLTALQQALVDRLRSDAVSACMGNPAGESADVVASVVCQAREDHSVQAFAYPDADAMLRDSKRRADTLGTSGRCALGNDVATTWTNRSIKQGDLTCAREQDRYTIFWTQYSDLVGFRIDGDAANAPAVYQYWLAFEPI